MFIRENPTVIAREHNIFKIWYILDSNAYYILFLFQIKWIGMLWTIRIFSGECFKSFVLLKMHFLYIHKTIKQWSDNIQENTHYRTVWFVFLQKYLDIRLYPNQYEWRTLGWNCQYNRHVSFKHLTSAENLCKVHGTSCLV